MRGVDRLLFGSRMEGPVACSAATTPSTVTEGEALLNNANAPVTCGAAIEVPDKLLNPFPRTDE